MSSPPLAAQSTPEVTTTVTTVPLTAPAAKEEPTSVEAPLDDAMEPSSRPSEPEPVASESSSSNDASSAAAAASSSNSARSSAADVDDDEQRPAAVGFRVELIGAPEESDAPIVHASQTAKRKKRKGKVADIK